MRIPLARAASILGHPLVVMPAAALWAASVNGATDDAKRQLVLVLAVIIMAVMGYSIWAVRSGRWAHIDASQPSERRSLNVGVAAALLAFGAYAWRDPAARGLASGLLVSGLALTVALLLSPLLKLSLHTCFATFAAGLLWPAPLAIVAGALLVGMVGWSRLALGRHTPAEVLLGAVVGAACALVFVLGVP